METRQFIWSLVIVSGLLALVGLIPRTQADQPGSRAAVPAVATFAGGCFWPQQEIFGELRGVQRVVAGYAGGAAAHPTYEQVVQGGTGHAETVQVYYNPQQISYQQLLNVFFFGSHNPTERNRQGPDTGRAVRSIAFYRNPQEQQLINATIKRANAEHRYAAPIVTQVVPLRQFWPAEAYHQGYYTRHPKDGYIAQCSRPLVEHARQTFSGLLRPGAAKQLPVSVAAD